MNCVIFFEFDDFVLAGVSKFKPITDLCGCTTTGRRRIRDVALVVSHFESSCDEELFDEGILDVDKINACFKLRAFLNQKSSRSTTSMDAASTGLNAGLLKGWCDSRVAIEDV